MEVWPGDGHPVKCGVYFKLETRGSGSTKSFTQKVTSCLIYFNNRRIFTPRVISCIFLGYDSEQSKDFHWKFLS